MMGLAVLHLIYNNYYGEQFVDLEPAIVYKSFLFPEFD